MVVETAADRALMLDDDEFALEATIGSNTFNGILTDEYIETADFSGSVPVFVCDESVATTAGASVGATITINSVAYTIRALEPDGTKMSRLRLEEQ